MLVKRCPCGYCRYVGGVWLLPVIGTKFCPYCGSRLNPDGTCGVAYAELEAEVARLQQTYEPVPARDVPYDPTVPPIEDTLAKLAAEVPAEEYAKLPDGDVLCDPLARVGELEAEVARLNETGKVLAGCYSEVASHARLLQAEFIHYKRAASWLSRCLHKAKWQASAYTWLQQALAATADPPREEAEVAYSQSAEEAVFRAAKAKIAHIEAECDHKLRAFDAATAELVGWMNEFATDKRQKTASLYDLRKTILSATAEPEEATNGSSQAD